MFISMISNYARYIVFHVRQSMNTCKRSCRSLSTLFTFSCWSQWTTHDEHVVCWQSRRSDVFIYHIVWHCATCLSIVYAPRQHNSSLVQLYEITNGRITLKSSYAHATPDYGLVSRFLQPYFTLNGTYVYMIQYDRLTSSNRSTSKAFPHVVRIDFHRHVRTRRQ
jgi:hypothetical protein